MARPKCGLSRPISIVPRELNNQWLALWFSLHCRFLQVASLYSLPAKGDCLPVCKFSSNWPRIGRSCRRQSPGCQSGKINRLSAFSETGFCNGPRFLFAVVKNSRGVASLASMSGRVLAAAVVPIADPLKSAFEWNQAFMGSFMESMDQVTSVLLFLRSFQYLAISKYFKEH